jgi:hypothetical protein
MAFALRNLSVLAYANGFTLWHYKAGEQTLDRVGGKGFFSPAADMIGPGDMVMVSAEEGARILAVATAGAEIVTAPLA